MHAIKICPTCGSKRIRIVRRDVTGIWGGRPFIAKDVEFADCPACGEKIYDREAMQQIEAAYPKTKSAVRRKAS